MKRLVLSLCALLMCFSLFAQEHLFEVKRLNNWGKEYLTIVNSYGYTKYNRNKELEQWYDSIKVIEGEAFAIGALVLEINGHSTKNMSENDFYAILDSCTENVELKVWHTTSKEPEKVILSSKSTIPDFANKEYIQQALTYALKEVHQGAGNAKYHNNYIYFAKQHYNNQKQSFKKSNTKCTELVDPDFDWFHVRTYDFAIVGNDPLTDRAILEKLQMPYFWTRDTENPDVIFTIAKDSKQSISSTYVPPTVRTINHGSQTKARYNALTNATEYTTTQNNQTIREGGYTQTTSNTDMFLELALLDAKRINDPNQQTAPIIWQATFNSHTTANVNVTEAYKAWATWVNMYDYCRLSEFTATAYTFERMWACSKDNTITYATSDSWLKEGDQIIKVKATKISKWSTEMGLNVEDSKAGENSIYRQWWGEKYSSDIYYDRVYAMRIKRANGKMVTLKYVPFLKRTGEVEVFCWKEYKPE